MAPLIAGSAGEWQGTKRDRNEGAGCWCMEVAGVKYLSGSLFYNLLNLAWVGEVEETSSVTTGIVWRHSGWHWLTKVVTSV